MCVVGNKCDKSKIQTQELYKHFNFIETSAKNNTNLDRMLLKMFQSSTSLSLPTAPTKQRSQSHQRHAQSISQITSSTDLTLDRDSENECDVGQEDKINSLPITKFREDGMSDRFARRSNESSIVSFCNSSIGSIVDDQPEEWEVATSTALFPNFCCSQCTLF